jgi:ribosomal protein L35
LSSGFIKPISFLEKLHVRLVVFINNKSIKINMKKSILKRLKITKTGKILRRKMGQSHCRAKKSNTELRRKQKYTVLGIDSKSIYS